MTTDREQGGGERTYGPSASTLSECIDTYMPGGRPSDMALHLRESLARISELEGALEACARIASEWEASASALQGDAPAWSVLNGCAGRLRREVLSVSANAAIPLHAAQEAVARGLCVKSIHLDNPNFDGCIRAIRDGELRVWDPRYPSRGWGKLIIPGHWPVDALFRIVPDPTKEVP